MTDFQPGQHYNVRVSSAYVMESKSGKPGIQINFEKEDGATIQHTLWISEKAVEYAMRDLATLGVPADKLASPTFIENIGTTLTGRECNVSIYEEEYNGKSRTRVQYINPVAELSDIPPAARIAELFGGPKAKPVELVKKNPKPVAQFAGGSDESDDADLPF